MKNIFYRAKQESEGIFKKIGFWGKIIAAVGAMLVAPPFGLTVIGGYLATIGVTAVAVSSQSVKPNQENEETKEEKTN